MDGGLQFNFSFALLVRAWRFEDSRAYEVKEVRVRLCCVLLFLPLT